MGYTFKEVQQLQTGHELSAAIATAYFGYKWYGVQGLRLHVGVFLPGNQPASAIELPGPPAGDWDRLGYMWTASQGLPPSYSTSIAQAWVLVELLHKAGGQAVIETADSQGQLVWRARFDYVGDRLTGKQALAPTAADAICRAALLVSPDTK